jgi:D-alanine transaminase
MRVRVYLNGSFVDEAEARVSVDDRGFLFGDAVYEVIRLYDGAPFRLEDHLARLGRSLKGVMLPPVNLNDMAAVVYNLAAVEGKTASDALVYIQVSRGASPRNHPFPSPPVSPTVVAWCRPYHALPEAKFLEGIRVVTVPDDRWAKCWIKTVNLLPNVLAKEKALRAGADDALFVRDGMAIEATSANVFFVQDGTVITAPITNYILPGISRQVVLELAEQLAIPVRLMPLPVEELAHVDEVFLTHTGCGVEPVAVVDGRRLGSGVGPVTRRLYDAFQALVGRTAVAAEP